MVRYTAELDTTIIGASATDGVFWQIGSSTRFYQDTGIEKVRLTHKLKAEIQAEDSVLMEISFRPESIRPPTSVTAIGEDFMRCTLTMDTSDSRFWQATIVDGYYTCSDTTTDPTNVCASGDDNIY